MGIGSNFVRKTFSGPAYDKYVTDLSRAELAPTTYDYNIDANKAAGNFIQDRISQTFGDNPISRGLGEIATYGAVPFAFATSPFHEAAQVIAEDKLKDYALPYSGDFANFTKAMLDQRVPQTMIERAGGVLQSTGLGQGIYDLAGKTQDIVSGIRQRNPGVTGTDYFDDVNISQPPGTDVGIMSNLKDLFDSRVMADEIEPMDVENFLEANRLNSTPDVVDVNRIPGRIQEAVEPQYRIRDQLSRDFLQGGLFRDAKKGLGQAKDAFLEDISGLTRGLGSIKDKGIDLKNKGIDFSKMIGRGIGNAIFPGLGFLIGNVKESPTDKFNLEIGKEFGDPYGYKGQLSSGTMGGRQDPFGRNLVSAFGNYEKNRMAEVARLNALATRNKFQQAQLDFGKDYLDKLEAKRQAAIQEMQAQNAANNTGGYQAGYSSDFMDGPSGTIGGQNQGLGGQQGKAGGTATMGSS